MTALWPLPGPDDERARMEGWPRCSDCGATEPDPLPAWCPVCGRCHTCAPSAGAFGTLPECIDHADPFDKED